MPSAIQRIVLVCSRCARGRRYCWHDSAGPARRESLREAGRRYQRDRGGRFAHARPARMPNRWSIPLTHPLTCGMPPLRICAMKGGAQGGKVQLLTA